MSSIDFTGGGGSATPAGNSGQLQFNDGGTPAQLDADSNLFWDDTAEVKHLGIQVGTTPKTTLHVGNSVGETLNAPTGSSATLVAETSISPPTASISQITELAATAGVTASQNLAGTFFTANGQTFDYSIQGVLQIGSTNYLSSLNTVGSYTDLINDATTVFSNDVSWTAVPNATHYVVYRQVNGGGYTAIKLVSGTSYNDDGADVAPTTTGWPGFYISNVSAPNSPASFNSATQNLGGTAYTASGQTINYEIDSYRTVNAVKYSSGTPVTISFTDTIIDFSTLFSVDLGWTGGGGEDGFILRKSFDGGSTWTYIDLGNVGSYTDDGYADDGSGTVWANPFSGFTGTTFSFQVYGNAASPNGAAFGYYTSSATTYTTTIANDNAGRILLHQFSGGTTNCKVLGASGSVAKYQTPQADFYDPGTDNGTVWDATTTVTPTHYGYTGTDLARTYRIYSYKTINGLTFYSSSYDSVSTTNTGGYNSVTIAYSIPSGYTGVKILREVNGGGFTHKIVLSSGTSIIDEALSNGFSTGSLGVTPTAYYHTTGRFDRDTSLSTDPAILEVISIAASSQWSKLRLGYAASSATATTTKLVDFLANSTGNLYVDTLGGNLYLGDETTQSVRLGAQNIFNIQGADIDFQIKSDTNDYAMFVDASVDTVYFGASSLAASVAAAVGIRANSDSDSCLVVERRNTQSADLVQWRNNGSSVMGGITAAGHLFLPTTGSTSSPNLLASSTTGFSLQSTKITTVISGVEEFTVDGSTAKFFGNSVILNSAALSTSATAGFTYIPTCAGAPSGTPGTQTGTVAMVYDTTNNHFYLYNGAWKKVALA